VQGDVVKIDLGGGMTVTQKKSDPLKIAYFAQGTANTYLQGQIKGAEAEAKKVGASITVFDGGFSIPTEASQMQNALASHQYNAFVGIYLDSSSACQPMSQLAPKENILVVPIIQPICNRGLRTGEGLWAPGTLASVNGGGSVDFYRAWALNAAKTLTRPTQVAYIAGPQGSTDSIAALAAMKDAAKQYPNFQLVAVDYTAEFAAAPALAETQNLLQSHPNIGLIMSHFTDMTVGVVQALNQAGKAGQVKVFDAGAGKADISFIKSGAVESSIAYWPVINGACGVSLVAAAHRGQSVPRSVLNDCRKVSTPGAETPFFVTKANVGSFTPEY
jgi:ribose transport system substrate-binding protein